MATPQPTRVLSSSRRRVWLRNLLLAAASSLLCLIGLEMGFRLAGYQAIYTVYSKPELFWAYDPLLGWSHEPSSQGLYVGPRPFPIEYRSMVHINSLGLRGPEVPPLPAGGLRVLVLGDSLAAGFEVPDDKTFSSLLEKRVSAEMGTTVQFLNAAVRGYGTDQAYLYYREHGKRFKPQLVLLMMCGNDFEDNTTLHRMRRPFGKPAFALKPDGALELVGYPTAHYPMCSAYRLDDRFNVVRVDGAVSRAACWVQMQLSDHSAFLTFVSMRIQTIPWIVRTLYGLGTPQGQEVADPNGAPGADYPYRLTSALVLKLASEVARDGAAFEILANEEVLSSLNEPRLEQAGIELFHVGDVEGIRSPGIVFRNDLHFTEAGHEALARFLAPRIENRLKSMSSAAGLTPPDAPPE
jgi:lysophospholipase L1-like esterase